MNSVADLEVEERDQVNSMIDDRQGRRELGVLVPGRGVSSGEQV